MSESSVAARVVALRARMAAAAQRAGRRVEEIELVGVAKHQPASAVMDAVRAGVRDIGENYAQESITKIADIQKNFESHGTPPPRWHFIGQLQRNKARQVVTHFDTVQTVDRESLGEALDRRAEQAGRSLEILLQINLSGESSKGGVAPDALPALLEASRHWSALRVCGLMTIPAAERDPDASRAAFAHLRQLRDALGETPGGTPLRELSMGMSHDFEVAIEEGATIIRVGTALFGPRR